MQKVRWGVWAWPGSPPPKSSRDAAGWHSEIGWNRIRGARRPKARRANSAFRKPTFYDEMLDDPEIEAI